MKKIILALIGFSLLAPEVLFCQSIQVRTAAITGDTAAYASGDAVGALLSLTDPNTSAPITKGIIRGVKLHDLAAQNANADVLFFAANPTGTTVTNNLALDVADADLDKIIGSVALTDLDAYADNAILQEGTAVVTSNLPFTLTAGTTLYAVVVARAARTQATNTDLTLKVYIESR